MASWVPDSWREGWLDALDKCDDHYHDPIVDAWNERLGPQPVIPGGRQVPVVYREPIPAKYFVTEKTEADSPDRFRCDKCHWETDDPEFCSFCGSLRNAA